jgi:RHS repeat-associated protein
MLMPGRSYSATAAYRYGFNGKENDNEVKGEGGQQDYGMRINDPRLGRFLSVDPLKAEFPWNSPYSFAENDAIRSVDLDGLEKFVVINFYDKYGRITRIRVESVVTLPGRQAVDQNFRLRGSNQKLTDNEIYVQYVRNGQFIAQDGSRNGSLTPKEQLAYNTTIINNDVNKTFDADNGILNPEGDAIGNEFNTSNSNIAFSYIQGSNAGITHEYQDGEKSLVVSKPVKDRDRIHADWVTGGINFNNSGVAGKAYGINVVNTADILSGTINDYVKTFKINNKLNVAFVDKITITLNNNKEIKSWNKLARKLNKIYKIQAVVRIDPFIERRNTNSSTDTGSGTYADIQYEVSGVKDGDKTKAAKGNQ